MSSAAHTTTQFPTRAVHDRSAGRLTVVVDALPASIDDITVTASSRRIYLRIEHEDTTFERAVSPPVRLEEFTDDREAVYNNGVLTVTVGTERRLRR
ncbi:Hsp20/alpha crystallin family protein [Natronorubrum sp. DTA28]|uniref:Hsp20/alpha crystallin family protein n=1 Tax=Natronorubrum sp. DTA28 TaxID=3447019 RepID=UPI003F826BFC